MSSLSGSCYHSVDSQGHAMKIDGRCHCGYVTFEAEADAKNTAICHCADCQMLSGSAFRTVVLTQKGSFKIRSGELKIYVKKSESGTQRPQAFCPECGTPIYSTIIGEEPKVYSVRVGTVRQRAELAPRVQLWSRSAQHRVTSIASIPKHETQPALNSAGGLE
jgi:hypothetical protein